MSMSGNRNSNEREQRIAFFAGGSRDAGAFVIALILLASGGFVLHWLHANHFCPCSRGK